MALTSEQNEYILELHELTNRSYSKAKELFNEKFGFYITKKTFSKKWKNAELELQNHGGHRYGFSKESFRELYNQYGGDITKIIKNTDLNRKSLLGLCYKHKLKPKKFPSLVSKDSR